MRREGGVEAIPKGGSKFLAGSPSGSPMIRCSLPTVTEKCSGPIRPEISDELESGSMTSQMSTRWLRLAMEESWHGHRTVE